ncbi:TolC family protein [Rhodocista pekingensis]|uniref:TolC family protein n=1 Tax=Rhodocista pekingensis TaxID=201185 RepID=A0ABW2L086_9PROT
MTLYSTGPSRPSSLTETIPVTDVRTLNGSPFRPFLLSAVAAVALAGCAVKPQPIPTAEHMDRATREYTALFENQEPLTGELSLSEALARALKYNYDHRLALMESALQDAQLDLAAFNMLPKLAASAGYLARSNEAASSSLSVLTRRQSLEPSTSQDKERWVGDLTLSWNVVDFGVAYFTSRQQADRALIAVERRRRVVNNLVKEVQAAYWRAATAELLLPQLERAIGEAESALAKSREIDRQRLGPLIETLEYQKTLLTVLSQLRRLRSDLTVAKAQLSALINVPPGSDFKLVPPVLVNDPKALSGIDMRRLEMAGLTWRPELREEAYQERIDRVGVWKEITRLFPNLQLSTGLNFDSNSYLVNQNWADLAVRATYNLFSLLQGPKAITAAEVQQSVTRTRRLALSVAVVTQINVSLQQYLQALEAYRTARDISDIETRIDAAVSEGGLPQTQSELDRIRRSTAAIAAELDRSRSYADLQGALANIYTAIGLDLLPLDAQETDLPALKQAIESSLAPLNRGELPPIPDLPTDAMAQLVRQFTAPPAGADPAASPAATPVAEAAATAGTETAP